MVCSIKCWVDLCLYCHMSGLEVVSESEVVVELLQQIVFFVFEKQNVDFKFDFPLLLRG